MNKEKKVMMKKVMTKMINIRKKGVFMQMYTTLVIKHVHAK